MTPPSFPTLSPFVSFPLPLPVSAHCLKLQVDVGGSCCNPEYVVQGGGYLYGLLELAVA